MEVNIKWVKTDEKRYELCTGFMNKIADLFYNKFEKCWELTLVEDDFCQQINSAVDNEDEAMYKSNKIIIDYCDYIINNCKEVRDNLLNLVKSN